MDDWSKTAFAAPGTTAVLVVTEPDALDEVTDVVRDVIVDVDQARGSCIDANVAAASAIVLGPAAGAWLEERRLPARLAHVDGTVQTACGWPNDETAVVARRSA